MSRSATVRTAFDRFNEKDFAGVLELFHLDADHADLLRPGVVHHGRDAILQLWTERFGAASVRALVAEVLEMDHAVVAVVCYQPYDAGGSPVGSSMIAVQHFIFRDDHIARIESTVIEDVSDLAKALFLRPDKGG